MVANQLNVELLKQAVKRKPKYEKAYKIFASRDRGRFETTFRRFGRVMEAEGETWSPEEINDFFELQEQAGAGSIVQGKDTPSFIWEVHLQSLACAVLNLPEPNRKRKSWSTVKTSSGALPKATPRRKNSLPRASQAVLSAKPTNVLPFVPTRHGDGQRVTFKKDGFEIDVDLEKLSPDACQKLTALLTTLKK